MEIKTNLCDNCEKYPITLKDYREKDGCEMKIYSCKYCHVLDDVQHNRVEKGNVDPKKLID